MIQWTGLIFSVAISALFAVPLQAGDTPTKLSPDIASDRANRHFVIASSNNFPPVNQLNESGHLEGFGKDLSDAVVEAIGGTHSRIHSAIWSDVLKWLAEGQADFIHDTGYSSERTAFLDYSKPILVMPEEIFVRVDRFDISNFETSKNHKIACVNNHITHLYLKNVPNIKCHIVPTPVDGLYALINGDVAAFIFPRQVLLHIAQRLNLINRIKVIGKPIRELTWHMTVRKGDEEMLGLINQGIAKIKASGQYDDIYERWFGKGFTLGYSQKELTIIVVIAAALSLSLGIMIALGLLINRMSRVQKILTKSIEEKEQSDSALRENEERFKDFAEYSSDWFWEMDADLRFSYLSDHYESYTGLPRTALLGKTREETGVQGIDQEIWENHLADLKAHREIRNFQHSRIKPTGEEIWISISGKPIIDDSGVFQGYRGTATDISKHRMAETAREAALVEAEQANSAKSEFLATMSHEFRTPLNAILGFSEIIRDQYFGPLEIQVYTEYADDIHVSGKHMLTMINDILDISTIEAGKRRIDKKDVVLVELLNSCLKNVEKTANDKGISLLLEIPDNLPCLYGDKRSVIQIVLNILSNAIKFTDRNGTVVVSAFVEESKVSIRVQDTGIGIPSDELPRISEPFAQTNTDPHMAQHGTGLGLYIVKSLVEAHDGNLTIESEIGVGTTLTVTFPSQGVGEN